MEASNIEAAREALRALITTTDDTVPAIGRARVDVVNGILSIGLLPSMGNDLDKYRPVLDKIVAGHTYELKSVQVIPDNTTKQEYCEPVWGGVRCTNLGTLSVVLTNRQGVDGVLMSAHVAGVNKTGQSVGQPNSSNTIGRVTVNPNMSKNAPRQSDSAFAQWTNNRRAYQYDAIWNTPTQEYHVVNWVIQSPNIGDQIYMQGAQQPGLSQGTFQGIDDYISDGVVFLENQALATYTAASGDSGAPVFRFPDPVNHPDQVEFLGIHAGRIIEDGTTYAYYSPWPSIADELGL